MAFTYGQVDYPLDTQSSGTSLLAVCDPLVTDILGFLSAVITAYAGDALIGASSSGFAPITSAVATTVSIDPETIAKVDQFKFPLLAVWRKNVKYAQQTQTWVQDRSRLGIAYILPPLTVVQSVRLLPILNSVSQIVNRCIRLGYDSNYQDGTTIFSKAVPLMQSGEYQRFPFGDTMDFHAWTGDLEVWEQVTASSDGFSPLTGHSIIVTDESIEEGNPVEMAYVREDA